MEYDFEKVPRIYKANYGLTDISYENKVGDRVYRLGLIKKLRNQAILKTLPKPRVPDEYKYRY